ncbi:hypothetical protein [Streptomyces sp. NPDC001927]
MTQSLEITSIGTVVGGRVEPTDDHWGGQAIIRLHPDFQEMGPRGDVREPSWPAEMLADYWRSRGLA